MNDRDTILINNPIDTFLQHRGHTFIRHGKELATLCPFHDDHHPSLRVNLEKAQWICDPCGKGGTVIDLVMMLDNLNAGEAIRKLSGESKPQPLKLNPAKKSKSINSGIYTVTDTYSYHSQYGQVVYCIDRLECPGQKKKFSQYQIIDGKRINNLDDVGRVLYRLPKVLKADEVWLVEGEKCVKACLSIGYCATCNPGGSSAWLDGYVSFLTDKKIVLCPDSDKPGEAWLKKISKSLEGKINSLRIIQLPNDNDIADLVIRVGSDDAKKQIQTLYDDSLEIDRGVITPTQTSKEMAAEYLKEQNYRKEGVVKFSRWLPELAKCTEDARRGDVITILADTGVGKTAMMASLAGSQQHLKCLFFQIELTSELMTERFVAMGQNITQSEVKHRAITKKEVSRKGWDHIYTCTLSSLSMKDIEEIIVKAELKMGEKPKLVFIDYIGLIKGDNSSRTRYERLSIIAEQVKVLAKKTGTVVVVGSQIRRDINSPEPNLHSAKDSGSIENSSSLVLGAWRPAQDKISFRILKNTRGLTGDVIFCDFDGARMQITPDDDHLQEIEFASTPDDEPGY